MFSVILENKNGVQLDLINNPDFRVVDIDGVGGASASINETENANVDGSVVNSERVNSRDISLSVRIFTNCGKSRETIYQAALIKQWCKLSLVNDIRSVCIEGQVKSVETPLFTQKQLMEIKIVCPEPYFREMQEIENEFSLYEKMFHFPFSLEEKGEPFTVEHEVIQAKIVNSGECTTGAIFRFRASGEVVNPILYNSTTGEYIKLNFTMQDTDEIVVDTTERNRSVKLIRNHIETNIISAFDLTSKWLQMEVGENIFTYSCESGSNSLEIRVLFTNKYLGV